MSLFNWIITNPTEFFTFLGFTIVGVGKALSWFAKNKLPDSVPTPKRRHARDTERMDAIEKSIKDLTRAIEKLAKPPRLTATERDLRDHAVRALAGQGFDKGDISLLLGCSIPAVKKAIGR